MKNQNLEKYKLFINKLNNYFFNLIKKIRLQSLYTLENNVIEQEKILKELIECNKDIQNEYLELWDYMPTKNNQLLEIRPDKIQNKAKIFNLKNKYTKKNNLFYNYIYRIDKQNKDEYEYSR